MPARTQSYASPDTDETVRRLLKTAWATGSTGPIDPGALGLVPGDVRCVLSFEVDGGREWGQRSWLGRGDGSVESVGCLVPVPRALHPCTATSACRYIWVTIIVTTSVAIAVYALVNFYVATANILEPLNPIWMFLSVKAILFASFWQSLPPFTPPQPKTIQGGGEGQELHCTVRVTRTIEELSWQ